MARGIIIRHQLQTQSIRPFACHGQANQTPPIAGHEVDRLWRGHLRGDDQITFVLTVFVIHQNKHPPVARIINNLLNGRDHLSQIAFYGARCFEW